MEFMPVSQAQQWLRSYTHGVQEMLRHFDALRVTPGSGIAEGSCCAVILGGRDVVYGNSQAHKLDAAALMLGRAHAEVVAYEIFTATSGSEPRLVFCEMSPCRGCQQKFRDRVGRIVYLFNFETERELWRRFHEQDVDVQLAMVRKGIGLDR